MYRGLLKLSLHSFTYPKPTFFGRFLQEARTWDLLGTLQRRRSWWVKVSLMSRPGLKRVRIRARTEALKTVIFDRGSFGFRKV